MHKLLTNTVHEKTHAMCVNPTTKYTFCVKVAYKCGWIQTLITHFAFKQCKDLQNMFIPEHLFHTTNKTIKHYV